MINFWKKAPQILLCFSIILQVSKTAHLNRRQRNSMENVRNPIRKVDIMVTIKSHGQNVFQNRMELTSLPTLPECTTSLPDCITTPSPTPTCSSDSTTPESFTCTKPGTFPNPESCSDFYVCHQNGGKGGLERVKLSCPSGLAFDRERSECTKRAAAECLSNDDVIVRRIK
ncbi:unnamed protein product [Phaedon cochleariae]|uniref:Chitin-binding type-2 domain-containing protein n=1 Tax=Phaedon cochleariae TaxID=80249 RepID=A0A9P0GN52_PHACE|nr:unnamed protein product [Phaedon cochleariae]